MTFVVANLFVTGVQVTGGQRFLLMLPLCLCIAIVYKTTRCESLREVFVASLILWGTIVLGMYVVGVGLWGLFNATV